MARPLRIQYPGAVYHVACRGNDRKNIFRSDDDRRVFLQMLSRSLDIYSVSLYAYVLMDNHFHVLVETPLGNLSEFMRHFNITYTGYFNRRYNRVGHLYQGRYKSILVEKDAYLSVLSRYIHLNPVRVEAIQNYDDERKIAYLYRYPWSSLPVYLNNNKREEMTDCSVVLGYFGGATPKGRAAYRKQLLADIAEELEIKNEIFSQSVIGRKAFLEWVKANYFAGDEKREQPAAKKIKCYQKKETILALIAEETGKDLDTIKSEKGTLRRLAMDLLFRYGGLRGPEIGALFGVGYSAVSQERKRLRESKHKNKSIEKLRRKLEDELSTMKI